MKIVTTATILLILSGFPAYAVGLSDEARELQSLYKDLNSFKDDPEFHLVGFDPCCRFNAWHKKVAELTAKSSAPLFRELGFVPAELRQLALEYMKSKGRNTSYSKLTVDTIEAGFRPMPEPTAGKGIVLATDTYCKSVKTYENMQAAMVTNKFAEVGRLLSSPDCIRVNEKTIVSSLGKTSRAKGLDMEYHHVLLPNGVKVWIQAGNVKF